MCMVTFSWEETDAKEKVKYFEKEKSLAWAVVELTESCNFNCMWCYANSGNSSDPKHMSKENLKKLIQTLANSGLKQITFSGGEPTLYPYLKKAVKLAKDNGFIVHMNTNGYLLTKKLAQELKNLGLSQVQINIDSLDSKKHDYIRGKEGSFYRAIKALKNAKEVGMTCVSQTVLTKLNETEILDIFKFARSLEIQRCRVWDMMATGHASEKTDLRPTNYMETLQKLAEFSSNTGAKNIETGDPLFLVNCVTNLDVSVGFCPALKGLFTTISSLGETYLCAVYRKSLYNVFNDLNGENALNEIHKIKLKEFIRLNKTPSKCKACNNFKICNGGCPARRGYTTEGVDYLCQYQ